MGLNLAACVWVVVGFAVGQIFNATRQVTEAYKSSVKCNICISLDGLAFMGCPCMLCVTMFHCVPHHPLYTQSRMHRE